MKIFVYLAISFYLPWITACKREPIAVTPPPLPIVTKAVMQNMQFSPERIEIKKGEAIEWTNEDLTPHTVTSTAFGDSGAINSSQSWTHTFNEIGEFPYVCTFHPTMKGTVIVK